MRLGGWGRKIIITFTFQLGLIVRGVVTSPNHPSKYPDNLRKTDTIKVEEGLVLALQFTAFNVEEGYTQYTCEYDHLTIQDGDGTTLMEKRCGSSLPANTIVSTSNIVELYFKTDHSLSLIHI